MFHDVPNFMLKSYKMIVLNNKTRKKPTVFFFVSYREGNADCFQTRFYLNFQEPVIRSL